MTFDKKTENNNKTRRAYIACENNVEISSNDTTKSDEETNLYLMASYESSQVM